MPFIIGSIAAKKALRLQINGYRGHIHYPFNILLFGYDVVDNVLGVMIMDNRFLLWIIGMLTVTY